MMTELMQSVGELGFIAAIAAFLVYFLTIRIAQGLDSIIRQVVVLQQLIVELLQMLLHHDAQIRGVNPTAGKDMSDAQETATKFYKALDERFERIESLISRTLDSFIRK